MHIYMNNHNHNQMSKHRELELLKKQEATLLQLHMTFSDQLNRLKVEELALTNLLRLQQEKDNKDDKVSEEDAASQMVKNDLEEKSVAVLDLAVGHPHNEDEEEEEDSEEEGYNYKDQLTTFLEDLLTQQKQEASERMGGVEDGEEET